MFRTTCKWCEPEESAVAATDPERAKQLPSGICVSHPKKHCSEKKTGIKWKVVKHKEYDSCPASASDEAKIESYLTLSGQIASVGEASSVTGEAGIEMLAAHKRHKEALLAEFDAKTKEREDVVKRKRAEWEDELDTCNKKASAKFQKAAERRRDADEYNKAVRDLLARHKEAQLSYSRLADRVKTFNSEMTDLLARMVNAACKGGSGGNVFDQQNLADYEAQTKAVAKAKQALIWDTVRTKHFAVAAVYVAAVVRFVLVLSLILLFSPPLLQHPPASHNLRRRPKRSAPFSPSSVCTRTLPTWVHSKRSPTALSSRKRPLIFSSTVRTVWPPQSAHLRS
jgi:hypothetical protein